ncbi:hypothetical protein [Gordonia hirsuta]|uniref:hypothetical protein n=1 Tax=Gordonia hirsuta TaxID=53427 RepID=UPI0012DCE9FF|nr:hypothetical protein [Gordonia hirsuta]
MGEDVCADCDGRLSTFHGGLLAIVASMVVTGARCIPLTQVRSGTGAQAGGHGDVGVRDGQNAVDVCTGQCAEAGFHAATHAVGQVLHGQIESVQAGGPCLHSGGDRENPACDHPTVVQTDPDGTTGGLT